MDFILDVCRFGTLDCVNKSRFGNYILVLPIPLQAVDRFVVGREDLGEVQFLLPVDLLGLDLDKVVDIEKGKIQVYGLEGEAKAPPLGQGLNAPAMLVFRYNT